MSTPPTGELAAIGSLHEPVRRALYEYVAGQTDLVSRDGAAAAVGIQRSLAAFHLDRLVEVGLLEATYRRLSGRSGPGAGRPAKLYRRSAAEHAISLPPRQYDLAARLLAEAVDDAGNGPAKDSLAGAARRFGRRLGEEARVGLPARTGRERRLTALAAVLERHGYEPRAEQGSLRLGNCPFHALAESHRDLVCGMNLALLEGVVEGVAGSGLEARAEDRPGACCVFVGPTERKG